MREGDAGSIESGAAVQSVQFGGSQNLRVGTRPIRRTRRSVFFLQLLKNLGCFVKADSFYHPPYGVSTLFFRSRFAPPPYPVRASGPCRKSARIDARSRLKYNLSWCDCAMRRQTVSIARIIRDDATKPVDRDANRRISGATG